MGTHSLSMELTTGGRVQIEVLFIGNGYILSQTPAGGGGVEIFLIFVTLYAQLNATNATGRR